jgi:hypothetical protein
MSITLASGKLIQINGATVENNDTGALMDFTVNFETNTFTATMRTGALASGALKPGQYGDYITITANLVSGKWTSSNGFSGTIGAGGLANFVNQFKADRNATETFSAGASGIMPGTQVPW